MQFLKENSVYVLVAFDRLGRGSASPPEHLNAIAVDDPQKECRPAVMLR